MCQEYYQNSYVFYDIWRNVKKLIAYNEFNLKKDYLGELFIYQYKCNETHINKLKIKLR